MNKEEIEIWKTIENYPDYMISNLGNVKSLKWNKEKLLKKTINRNGYNIIRINFNNIKKTLYIHRLVAQAFLINQNNYRDVEHIDCDKSNNSVSNLRWCTHQENCNNLITRKRISFASKCKKKTKEHIEKCAKARQKPIACYNKNGDLVALYTSAKQASELLNINQSHISDVCNSKRKSAGGYIFKYIKKVS